MNIFDKLDNKLLPKVQNGCSQGVSDFFNKTIRFQFENTEMIKKTHLSILKYINTKNPVFFLRLYFSNPKSNYHLQRRGFLSQYKDQTRVSFCDNTFTLLFTAMKLAGITYSSEDLEKLFNQKKLIVGFAQVSEEKELSFYSPIGAKRAYLNSKGWYQAHIKPAGYGYEGLNLTELFPNPNRELFQKNEIRQVNRKLTTEQKVILKAHFLRLIHPFNNFLVPKKNLLEYQGHNIGEENELINFVRSYIEKTFPVEYKEFDELSIKYKTTQKNSQINKIQWFEKPNKKIKKSKNNISADLVKSFTNKKTTNHKEIKLVKYFVLKKSYYGSNHTIRFIDSNNNTIEYNHDSLLSQLNKRITDLPCWEKYGYYINSKRLPRFVEGLETVKHL